jgi:hypothetical protein
MPYTIDKDALAAALGALGPGHTSDSVQNAHDAVAAAEKSLVFDLLRSSVDAVALDPSAPFGTKDPILVVHLDAVMEFRRHDVSVLVGPAGPERIRLLRLAAELHARVAMRSGRRPTVHLLGATRRTARAMGVVSTVHSALGWDPVLGTFDHGPFDPLDGDLILVEEADVLEPSVLTHLLASRGEATVVLTRDPHRAGSIPPTAFDVEMDPSRGIDGDER